MKKVYTKNKPSFKERQEKRKEDFRRGYVSGYEDGLKSLGKNYLSSKYGYGKGYKDSVTVNKIKGKYNTYKKG